MFDDIWPVLYVVFQQKTARSSQVRVDQDPANMTPNELDKKHHKMSFASTGILGNATSCGLGT